MDSHERLDAPEQREKKKPASKRFLAVYAFSLLAVAFILVLLSYLAQLRDAQEELDEVRRQSDAHSISAMQSVDDLRKENAQLLEELEALNKTQTEAAARYAALQETYDQAEKRHAMEADAATKQSDAQSTMIRALVAFDEIEQLYRGKDYDACRKIIDDFGHEALLLHLPDGDTEDGDRLESMKTRYEKIYNKLYN
ncbi:hypothetical protein LJC32_02920 [Oscillospiraceae bacterium OttesenSCG-928-F05]|nr:hypothetical protein [Oscillospiraceae bacterium OttesenSCG-928-F05]